MIRSKKVLAERRQSIHATQGYAPAWCSRYWPSGGGPSPCAVRRFLRGWSFQPRDRPAAMDAIEALARHHPYTCMYLGCML